MTKDDVKHAVISLVIGVLTMAGMQILNGLVHIFSQWVTSFTSGSVAAVAYLHQTFSKVA